MEKYKCIKTFELSVFDEDGRMTDEKRTVNAGSIYETTPGYVSNSDVRLYLEDGDDDFGYIDITHARMEECFVRVG